MKEMYTDSRYKNSHKKSAKIFAKAPCKVLDIKPRSVQNSQLHSFTASQLKGTCAQIKQSHTTKFSHIKKFYRLEQFTKNKILYGVSKGVSPLAAREKEGGHRGRENPALNGVFSPPKRGVNL